MIRGKINSYTEFCIVMKSGEPYAKLKLIQELQDRDIERFREYMRMYRQEIRKTEYMGYRWKFDD